MVILLTYCSSPRNLRSVSCIATCDAGESAEYAAPFRGRKGGWRTFLKLPSSWGRVFACTGGGESTGIGKPPFERLPVLQPLPPAPPSKERRPVPVPLAPPDRGSDGAEAERVVLRGA